MHCFPRETFCWGDGKIVKGKEEKLWTLELWILPLKLYWFLKKNRNPRLLVLFQTIVRLKFFLFSSPFLSQQTKHNKINVVLPFVSQFKCAHKQLLNVCWSCFNACHWMFKEVLNYSNGRLSSSMKVRISFIKA